MFRVRLSLAGCNLCCPPIPTMTIRIGTATCRYKRPPRTEGVPRGSAIVGKRAAILAARQRTESASTHQR